MTYLRPLAVLRPEPGNAATCARIADAGATALALPLFAVAPLAWTPPPAAGFDALLLTSANAVRHAGPALARYAALPVFAVGEATAAAARAAGLAVAFIGRADATALLAAARERGVARALHLTGHDRADDDMSGVATAIPVYASVAVTPAPDALAQLVGSVALLHSPRAGARLATLLPDRAATRIAAISAAALAAAGSGWAGTTIAAAPDDAALVAAALVLAD